MGGTGRTIGSRTVRHIRQIEHTYLAWGFGGGTRSDYYGDDDYAGGSALSLEDDERGHLTEVERSDASPCSASRDRLERPRTRPTLGFVL